jgi:hypothetical protein
MDGWMDCCQPKHQMQLPKVDVGVIFSTIPDPTRFENKQSEYRQTTQSTDEIR